MVSRRACGQVHPDGRPCGAPPLTDSSLCYWHDPDKSEEAAEARRLGGLRRKRERTIAGAYDLAGLGDVASVRRVLEIAVLDALGLDNSLARSKLLIGAAGAAAKPPEAEREENWGWHPHDDQG
jgi:hypothetical protein